MSLDKRLDILSKSIIKDIEIKLAKSDKTIKEHIIELLEVLDVLRDLGYLKDERIFNLAQKACIYHDLGKLNEEFQNRVKSKEKKLRFNKNKEIVHNVLSAYFIDDSKFEQYDDYLKVAHSVINHHNYGDTTKIVNENKDMIYKLIDGFDIYDFDDITIGELSGLIDDIDSIKIKGYLHKCDYNASAGSVAEYPNDFLDTSMENLLEEWKNHDKNAKWNLLQKFCKDNCNENNLKGNIYSNGRYKKSLS